MKLKQKIERHFTSYAKNDDVEKKSFNTNNTLNQNTNKDMETRNIETKTENKNFSIKNFIESLEKRELTKEQTEYLEANRKNFVELGYNCPDANLIDKRGIVAASIAGTQQLQSEGFQKPNNIFQYCKTYDDLVCSCKIPVVSELNPQWLGETASITNSDPNISGLYFTPQRLGTVLNVSKMFLNQSGNMENELIGMMNNELDNKLISTIFTDYENQGSTDSTPSGIFNSSNQATFTNIDDIIDLPYNVQVNSGLGYYVISPKAKKEILKLQETAFSNNTLFGENYIIEPLMKDGLIAYINLSKLVVCSWNYIDLTIDHTTKAHKGENIIYLTGYYDFRLISNNCAKWLDMETNSGSGVGE